MDLLDFILECPKFENINWTEADTRAQFIDPILGLLGWTPLQIKREPYAGWSESRGYIDYLLVVDDRAMIVVEAKKTERSFNIPSNLSGGGTTTFRKLRATASNDLLEALDQCLRYAQHTGALYACATNGIDWVIFKPSHPHRSLPDAKVIIFKGSEQLAKRIDQFVDVLSPDGIEEGRTEKALLGRNIQVPSFAKRLRDQFPHRGELTIEQEDYSNILDQILKHYVVELTNEADFRECYIPAKSNRTASGMLKTLISNIESSQNTNQSSLDFGSDLLTGPVLDNVACGRTMILHGEVGVGKTSFLRHCELSLKEDGKLTQAVWARIDLLPFQDRHFSSEHTNEMLNLICKRIQEEVSNATEEMAGSYDPDVWAHLRDIYNKEVRVFQKGRFPNSDNNDAEFLKAATKYVWQLREEDPQKHLIRVIRWLTLHCKLPTVIALDNSDQLGIDFQEFLYKLTETIKSTSSAVVILVVRTEALESHVIREHSIAAVNDQFVVNKASLPAILNKRFQKILNNLPSVYAASTDKVARDRITTLMETLQYEASLGSDAFQLVEAAGNGSLRDNLRATSSIFRVSPKMMDQLVVNHNKDGRARLTTSQVLRAMMKDDLRNSDSRKLIPNVFSVDSAITMPHSLGIRQLQQIRAVTSNSPCTVGATLNALSLAGIDRSTAHKTLVRLRSEAFLSTSHMLENIQESDILQVTPLGNALLDIILFEESYFSNSAFNTFVYRKDIYNNMRNAWASRGQDYRLTFGAIAKQFIEMIVEDDEEFLRTLDISNLEPIIGQSLPGILRKNLKKTKAKTKLEIT